MKNSTVVILGGAGLVGNWIRNILAGYEYDVRLVDNKISECGSYQLDVTKPTDEVDHIFKGAIAVVFALPEGIAVQAVSWLMNYIPRELVIISTCSVQEPFYRALKVASNRQPYIGINPMFSPVLSCQGRVVAVCLEDLSAPVMFLEAHLVEAGAKLKRVLPRENDEVMAVCQVLPHVAILGFGKALAKTSLSINLILEIMPPPMRCMMALLARILVGSPEVYWGIQTENKYAQDQRKAIVQGIEELMSCVVSGEFERFKEQLLVVSHYMDVGVDSGAIDCQRIFSLLK